MRLSLTVFLFLLLSTNLLSQRISYLYPIKKDHKWGYIDKRGRIIIEPKYDAIGDRVLPYSGRTSISPYRLVEVDGKLGIIDKQCEEVLTPKYDYISPLNFNHFIIKEDTFSRVINNREETALQGTFQDIKLLDTVGEHYFKVKINGHWGVHTMEQGELLPSMYEGVYMQRAGAVFFKVKKPGEKEGWGLVDINNRQILANKYADVKCINEQLFATREYGGGWMLRDGNGNPILHSSWARCTPLNKSLVGLADGLGTTFLYSISQKDTLALAQQFAEYRPYNEQFVLYQSGGNYGLMDNSGTVVMPPDYESIRPAFDSLYLVKSRWAGWGIHSLSRGLILPCSHSAIREEGQWLKVSRAGLWGLMDRDFQEVIPAAFDRMMIADTLIKAYENNKLTLFKVMADGQVALLEEFNNVQTLRVGFTTKSYQVAKSLKPPKRRQRSVLDPDASPFTAQTDGRWIWYRDTDTQRWGLKDQESRSVTVPPNFVDVLHLKKPNLSLVLTDGKISQNDQSLLPALKTVNRFLRAALFSHETGKFITPFDLLAIRGQDFKDEIPLAVFLDKNGQFGLMDKHGNDKSLRFTWVGEFLDGRARFCQGGRLALAEEGKSVKKGLGKVTDFMVAFGLHITRSFGSIQDRTLVIEKDKNSGLLWGYVDTLGQVVIDAQYDFAGDFENGYAVNQKDGNWGVIDMDGKEQLPFKYNSVSQFHGHWLVGVKSPARLIFNPNGYERVTKLYARQGAFSENRCRVEMDSLWGFIDEEGNEVIACQYGEVRPFSEGLAAVFKEGKWGFVDKDGHSAFGLHVPDGDIIAVGDFSNGLVWFKVGYRYGYINKKGEVAVPLDFTKVFDFKFGVARAVFKGKTGLIDTTGQWILQPKRFEYVTDFNQWGVAEAREKFKGSRCLINANGEVLTPLKYKHIGTFHEGFADVANGQFYGLINTKGKEVLPMEYAAIGQVSEGLLAVRPRNSTVWHFVDTLGHRAFDGEFVVAEPFQFGHSFVKESHFDPTSRYVINRQGERLVIASTDQFEFYESGIFGLYTPLGEKDGFRKLNYYYADASGQRLFGRLFEKIKPYKGNAALIQQSHRWGMLNRNGLFVLPPKYPFVNMQDNGEAVVNLPVLFGLVDKDGKEVFPPEFDRIRWMRGNRFRLEMGEKVGYAKEDGEWVWELGK